MLDGSEITRRSNPRLVISARVFWMRRSYSLIGKCKVTVKACSPIVPVSRRSAHGFQTPEKLLRSPKLNEKAITDLLVIGRNEMRAVRLFAAALLGSAMLAAGPAMAKSLVYCSGNKPENINTALH